MSITSKRFTSRVLFPALLLSINLAAAQVKSDTTGKRLELIFKRPPPKARPMVWWHWMGSNFSKAGITKDLEAMKNMGIGGGTIFNLSSAVEESMTTIKDGPWPSQTYRSPAYWDALRFAASEAKRLGLEIGLHNTVGYSTTGGPWIDQQKGMQKLVWRAIKVSGGKDVTLELPVPELPIYTGYASSRQKAVYYQDIAVLGIVDSNQTDIKQVLNLTSRMEKSGKLTYRFPSGNWTVYRFCYAPTMSNPHPMPEELFGKILEVDKMNRQLNEFHWSVVIDSVKKYLGPYFGNSFTHMLIDSYEAGNQNWTPGFAEEFIKLKGYDPVPWLVSLGPVLTDNKNSVHKIIGDEDQTRRFEYDYKDVVNTLYFRNGWEVAKDKLKAANLRLNFEPYGGPFDIVQGSALADVPMGEFWTHSRSGVNVNIPGAARAAGKTIVGAESFTSSPQNSKWTEDPATLKPIADGGFASGANQLYLHHWVHQPFDDKYQPGMGMGWWGTHFSRFQTWFEPGKAFISYLTRTQALLQFGEQVANVLYVEKVDGYGDVISIRDLLMQDIRVSEGKIILPSGRKYAYISFPARLEMLPEVASKIKQLVKNGATVVAPKPVRSPSMSNYPQCDSMLRTTVKEVWADSVLKRYGKGFIVSDLKAGIKAKLPALMGAADFSVEGVQKKDMPKIVHRQSGNCDWYFIVNTTPALQRLSVNFNVTGKQPELWQTETGDINNATTWLEKNGKTEVSLELKGLQSIFVVFRNAANGLDHPAKIISTDSSANWSITMTNRQKPGLSASSSMKATIVYASGKTVEVATRNVSQVDISHDWKIDFTPKLEKPFSMEFKDLSDFSRQDDTRLKYFSGTALYTKIVDVRDDMLAKDQRVILDLGTVHDIVSLTINGKDAGVLWYPPFKKDISAFLKPGKNDVKIAVTNNWANRLIGDEQEPADFAWGNDRGDRGRAMAAFPDWFLKNKPRPSKRKAFSIWYYYRKDSPLQPSGLVGPVILHGETVYDL